MQSELLLPRIKSPLQLIYDPCFDLFLKFPRFFLLIPIYSLLAYVICDNSCDLAGVVVVGCCLNSPRNCCGWIVKKQRMLWIPGGNNGQWFQEMVKVASFIVQHEWPLCYTHRSTFHCVTLQNSKATRQHAIKYWEMTQYLLLLTYWLVVYRRCFEESVSLTGKMTASMSGWFRVDLLLWQTAFINFALYLDQMVTNSEGKCHWQMHPLTESCSTFVSHSPPAVNQITNQLRIFRTQFTPFPPLCQIRAKFLGTDRVIANFLQPPWLHQAIIWRTYPVDSDHDSLADFNAFQRHPMNKSFRSFLTRFIGDSRSEEGAGYK